MEGRASRHRALRESFQANVVARGYLEEREPALINLPIPLPSIPILNDILTFIIDGTTVTSTSTVTTTPTAAPTTATTSTPPSATTTPSSGSGSSSGGDSGDSGSGSSSGSSGSDGSGSGLASSGSSGSSNSSDSSGDSGSSGSDSSGSSGSSGASDAEDSSTASSPSANASGAGSSGASPTDAGSSGASEHSTPSGNGVLAAETAVVGNVASDPAVPFGSTSYVVTGGKTVAVVGSVTYSNSLPTYTPGSTQTGGASAANGSSISGSGETTSDPSSKHGVSAIVGPIVGVLLGLLLLILILFGIRRRALSKRNARKEWWAGVMAPGAHAEWRDSGDATMGTGTSAATRSIRSSFGTTFDHSEFSITFDDNVAVPELPAMVEIRGGPAIVPKGDSSMAGNGQPLSPISPISPDSPAIRVPLLVNVENSNVYSDANRRASTGSNNSSSSTQYITYDRADGATNNQLASTPMSVRPFSPTESFAFPSPPRSMRSSDFSYVAASTINTPRISLAPPTIIEPLPPNISHAEAYVENPFADAFSVPTPMSRASAEFAATETIWRPFEQTLQDEMSVHVGDQVKVLAVYDDGWAMIERVGIGKGKGKAVDGAPSVGLVPIDCMRKADESVASFLAAKRASSVNATGYTAMAV